MTTPPGRSTSTRLTLAAIRSGALRDRPVAVLGLARSGIALARFLADARRARDGLRRPPGRASSATRSPRSTADRSGSPSGPDVDPGRDLGGRRRWSRTSPSINTRLPDDRAAPARRPAALVDARAAGDRRAGARVRGRPVPAPVPGADHRGDRHEGQDDDRLADRGAPGRRPGAPGRAGRQHRRPARRAAARADARPPGRRRAVRAAAADAVARHDRRRLHARHRPTTSIATGRSRRTGGSSAGWPSWSIPTGALVLNAEDPVVAGYAGLGRAPRRPVPARAAAAAAASASSTAGSSPTASSDSRWPAAGPATTGPDGRIMPIGELAHPGRPQRQQRAGRGRRRARCSASRPTRSARPRRRSPASSTGSSRSPSIDGVRFVNDSQGTQPDAVIAALRASSRRSC